MIDPTAGEEKELEKWLGIPIPTHDDMTEIEESSRFYMENGAQYMTAPLIYTVDGDKRDIAPVTFILTGSIGCTNFPHDCRQELKL